MRGWGRRKCCGVALEGSRAPSCDKTDPAFLYDDHKGYDCAYIARRSLEWCDKAAFLRHWSFNKQDYSVPVMVEDVPVNVPRDATEAEIKTSIGSMY